MLTTDQILNAMFTPISRGAYSAEEVDAFLKTVAESYEQALQDNKELIKKISILADKIESYRSDEEAIKLALLDARRLAETIGKEAGEKADAVVADAQAKSKTIIDDATAQSNQMVEEARERAKEIVDNARVAVTSLTDRAQNETEQAITAAQQKATEIVLKAEAQGKEIIGRSKADFEYYSCELERIVKETEAYKATAEKLCKDQLALLDAVKLPEVTPVERAAVREEVIPEPAEEIAAEEKTAVVEEKVIEEYAAPVIEEPAFEEVPVAQAPVFEVPAAEEPTYEVQEEAEESEEVLDVLDVPVYDEPVADEEEVIIEDDDDIFSLIEDLNFEDIVAPEAIPATLDEAIAEQTAVADADDGEDLESFNGFGVNLDELDRIASDVDLKEDEDITSLFDSFFNE